MTDPAGAPPSFPTFGSLDDGRATLVAARTTPTALWNDSADPAELIRAIDHGAVGATCNPVIALTTIRGNPGMWGPRLARLANENPHASENTIGWLAIEQMSIDAAKLLEPVFHAHHGRNGRLSVQTDPRLHRSTDALVAQAQHFDSLAPNIIVKIPATQAGIEAMRQATYLGISINATVSFSVAQAVAVAEAVEESLLRREAEGLDTTTMGPVCTIMGGRLDDWIKESAVRDRVLIDPGYFEWAGVAALKKAYHLLRERGLRTRILSAAFRNHLQWSELLGGDLVVSPPFDWQLRINENHLSPEARIDVPVDPAIVGALHERCPEFRKAYDEDGMTVEEFEEFGASRRTMRQFLQASAELDSLVRDLLVPEPGS
ncbi:transaldolase [Sanguibacter gelidistatuariae]|uniref:Transaldolase n=1 Tax=Sanguibacter gelidistatuariae TaxID=1814289 RepID=A0A1G6HVF5_9MICO|nr:transaldolase family protein [Sanguibacter gelidistatuariae]SDB98184.1 transaldolase [Sanguibacter gelidistatuariae]